jgi:hypothetical protein
MHRTPEDRCLRACFVSPRLRPSSHAQRRSTLRRQHQLRSARWTVFRPTRRSSKPREERENARCRFPPSLTGTTASRCGFCCVGAEDGADRREKTGLPRSRLRGSMGSRNLKRTGSLVPGEPDQLPRSNPSRTTLSMNTAVPPAPGFSITPASLSATPLRVQQIQPRSAFRL